MPQTYLFLEGTWNNIAKKYEFLMNDSKCARMKNKKKKKDNFLLLYFLKVIYVYVCADIKRKAP